MSLTNLALSFACAIVFIACGTSDVAIKYPKWYLESSDEQGFLVGVGSGKSLDEAKAMALNDIASKISVSVESNLNIQNTLHNDDVDRKIDNAIALSVRDMELDGLSYPKVESDGGFVFAQAKVQKSKLANKINKDIDGYAIEIKNVLGDIKDSRCQTPSPKHRITLENLRESMIIKMQEVEILGFTAGQKGLMKNLDDILSVTPNAYHQSSASANGVGVGNSDYTLIENALLSEYGKFFKIVPKNSDFYHIANSYTISKKDGKFYINLDSSIKDCNGNAIFSTSVESSSMDKKMAIETLRARVYKKFIAYLEN